MRIPERGEIWNLNLNPTAGQEQQGRRPVIVASPKMFNRAGLMLVCPITQGGLASRFAGFAVSLINSGIDIQGVVLCNQSRTIDYVARHAKFVEVVPNYLVEEVLAKMRALLE